MSLSKAKALDPSIDRTYFCFSCSDFTIPVLIPRDPEPSEFWGSIYHATGNVQVCPKCNEGVALTKELAPTHWAHIEWSIHHA